MIIIIDMLLLFWDVAYDSQLLCYYRIGKSPTIIMTYILSLHREAFHIFLTRNSANIAASSPRCHRLVLWLPSLEYSHGPACSSGLRRPLFEAFGAHTGSLHGYPPICTFEIVGCLIVHGATWHTDMVPPGIPTWGFMVPPGIPIWCRLAYRHGASWYHLAYRHGALGFCCSMAVRSISSADAFDDEPDVELDPNMSTLQLDERARAEAVNVAIRAAERFAVNNCRPPRYGPPCHGPACYGVAGYRRGCYRKYRRGCYREGLWATAL